MDMSPQKSSLYPGSVILAFWNYQRKGITSIQSYLLGNSPTTAYWIRGKECRAMNRSPSGTWLDPKSK